MRTLTLIALLSLTGCSEYFGNKPEEVAEPQKEWFDSPAADEAILKKAFVDSVFIIDPASAVFSNVSKINRSAGSVDLGTDWCGFVRLKNGRGNYIGSRVFHVTMLKGKPYLAGFEGSDMGTPDYGCRGHPIFGS